DNIAPSLLDQMVCHRCTDDTALADNHHIRLLRQVRHYYAPLQGHHVAASTVRHAYTGDALHIMYLLSFHSLAPARFIFILYRLPDRDRGDRFSAAIQNGFAINLRSA